MQRIDVLAPQFSDDAGFVTSDEDDAYTIAVFTPNGDVAIAYTRTSRGNLRIFGSDLLHITARMDRLRWASLDAALKYLTSKCGVWFATVDL